MIFEEIYFSRFILLSDEFTLSDCLYFLRYLAVCEVSNFEIHLSFLIKPFSYVKKKSEQKSRHFKNEKSFKDEIKCINHQFYPFSWQCSIDLAYKSIDWFLYEGNTSMKKVTELSLKQIKPTSLGGESPTLKIAGLVLFSVIKIHSNNLIYNLKIKPSFKLSFSQMYFLDYLKVLHHSVDFVNSHYSQCSIEKLLWIIS